MGLLLRAAELTLEGGHDWFATVNRATERDVRYSASPDPFYYDRYEATAEIVVGSGPKPAGDPNAFDAREVVQNLGPRLARAM